MSLRQRDVFRMTPRTLYGLLHRGRRGVFDTKPLAEMLHDHLEPNFGHESDNVLRAAIYLCVTFLSSKALGLGNSQAGYALIMESVFHVI